MMDKKEGGTIKERRRVEDERMRETMWDKLKDLED